MKRRYIIVIGLASICTLAVLAKLWIDRHSQPIDEPTSDGGRNRPPDHNGPPPRDHLNGGSVPQPPPPHELQPVILQEPDPVKSTLKKYLNEDHQDFLTMKVEMALKGQKPETLKRLLDLAAADPNFIPNRLQPLLLQILNKQLDKSLIADFLTEYDTFLTTRWKDRKRFLGNKQNIKLLALTTPQLKLVRELTFEEYRKRGLEGLKRRYQEKAVIALQAINSPAAKKALQEFRTEDKSLQGIIDYYLGIPVGPE